MKIELIENPTVEEVEVGDMLVLENGEKRIIVQDRVTDEYTLLDPQRMQVTVIGFTEIENLLSGYPIKRIIKSNKLIIKEV